MPKNNNNTFEGLMEVMARELGLTKQADFKKYIDVTLAIHDGYPNNGDFDFSRNDRTAKSDYCIDAAIHELRQKIEKTKKGKALLESLGTENYAIPVPGIKHRVFKLPTNIEGYRWILDRINNGGSIERLG